MKRLTALLLSLLLLILASCSGSTAPAETPEAQTAAEGNTENVPSDGGPEDSPEAAPEAAPETPKSTYIPDPNNQYTGGVGFSQYSTSVSYADIKVTNNADRTTLLDEKFDDTDLSTWNYFSRGNWDASKTSDWSISDGNLIFTDTNATGASIWTGDINWGNYNVTVKCKAVEGIEGFGIYFAVKDSSNYYYFNLGGWSNTVACVEWVKDGQSGNTDKIPFAAEYGEEYTVTVNVGPKQINGFVNGEQIFQIGGEAPSEPFGGMVGLSNWSTATYVDNIKVASFADGTILYENTFDTEDSLADLKHDLEPYSGGSYTGSNKSFSWVDGTLQQKDSSTTAVIFYVGDESWSNYIYSIDVMPYAGAEGSAILGAIKMDGPSYVLYNCGGWSNTVSCWQTYDAGTTDSYNDDGIASTIEYDEWHTLSLVVLDYAVFAYIDGVFYQSWWG